MPSSRRAAATALTRMEDSQRSLSQWKKLDVASLRLKCNTYYITPSGKKPELAAALFDFFEQERNRVDNDSPVTSDNESPDENLPTESPDHSGSNISPASDIGDGDFNPNSDYHEMRTILDITNSDDDLFTPDDDASKRSRSRSRSRSPTPRRPLSPPSPVATQSATTRVAFNIDDDPSSPIHNGGTQPDSQSDHVDLQNGPITTNTADRPALHDGGTGDNNNNTQYDPNSAAATLQLLFEEIKTVRGEVSHVRSENKTLRSQRR